MKFDIAEDRTTGRPVFCYRCFMISSLRIKKDQMLQSLGS